MELLRDRSQQFEEAGVSVYGVSRDSPWTNFPLLSDWNGEAVRAFDVAHEFRGFAEVAERSAFVVDPGGTVRAAWRYESSELPDFDVLLDAARAS